MTAATAALGRSDSRLDYLDQAGLKLLRATGRGQLMQAVWIYPRALDPEGLARLHREFGSGLLGRLIERSPLPFCRPRWVAARGPQCEVVAASESRPRSAVIEWADELARLPIDPEEGPGWLLGTLPLTDGGTAVSIVFSHCLVDGGGTILTLFNVLSGHPQDFGYPPPHSRGRVRGALSDLADSAREIPHLLSALRSAARLARRPKEAASTRNQHEIRPQTAAMDQIVSIPSAVAFLDVEEWDARAADLGGNSFSLVAGYATKLAAHVGRRRASDGVVTLVIAGNARTDAADERALAMTFATAHIDPDGVTTDLTDARRAIRQARETAKAEPDPTFALLPMIPWFPRRLVKGMAGMMFSYDQDPPVSCSNVGELPDLLTRADGSPAEFFFARSVDQNVTLRDLQRSNGTLVLVSGRMGGKIWLAVESYELGAPNTRTALREAMVKTLADFNVSGTVV